MFPQNTLPADVQSNEEKNWLDFHGQETAGRLDLSAKKKGSHSMSGASNDDYYFM